MSAEPEPHLAEVNVARLRAPLDSPEMAGLLRALDDVNWLAERSEGFVWRLRADDGRLTLADFGTEGEVVVTLSVWESFAALQQYVYRRAHGLFMQRRSRWFEPIGGFTTAMWWVPAGTEPSVPRGWTASATSGRTARHRTPSPCASFDASGERLRV